jgi:hypothetical protein
MFQVVISKVVGRFVRDEHGATMLEYRPRGRKRSAAAI